MVNRWLSGLMLAATLIISACSITPQASSVTVDAHAQWALLPINNLSTTPQAGVQALTMVETTLRARGVTQIGWYQPEQATSLVALLDTSAEMKSAVRWAKNEGHRYALSGTVHEWQYKSGPDKEPVVGVSLKLIDLNNDQVIWQSAKSKTGWGYANLSGVASKTIDAMLKRLRLNGR